MKIISIFKSKSKRLYIVADGNVTIQLVNNIVGALASLDINGTKYYLSENPEKNQLIADRIIQEYDAALQKELKRIEGCPSEIYEFVKVDMDLDKIVVALALKDVMS